MTNREIGRAVVLGCIKSASDGYTRDQVSDESGLCTATVCARANELLKENKIEVRLNPDGTKIKRPTKTGTPAEVLYYVKD
ncbi:hypothetical protein [Synechococcus phage S-H38]|uniref:Uncharacterized protein n=1 Tax=Synechococcus phage S-H38 TaxID=2783673 RepID=A0A873WD16_9CAUD|nr:hypothetical protein PQC14_gp118 [Synechococcus phage S-H38]QPB07943.1 hypothetical protein [Synechococcus phage S-H38]